MSLRQHVPCRVRGILILSAILVAGAALVPGTFRTFSTESASNEFYVSATGNDSNAGTLESPWRSVQTAASRLRPGDTVYVRGGVYKERIRLSKSGNATEGYVTLRNYQGEVPILNGAGLPAAEMILGTNIKYCKIQGFRITENAGAGIVFYGASDHIEIRNNEISHQSGSGHAILVSTLVWPNQLAARDIIVDGNYLHDLVTGVDTAYNEALTLAFDIERFQITNNIIERTSYIGIDMIGKSATFMDGYLPKPHTITQMPWPRMGYVSNNVVTNGGRLSSVSAIYVDGGKDIVIENNAAGNNYGYGIVVSSEDQNFVTERIIVRNNRSWSNTRQYAASTGGKTQNIRFVHNTAYTQKPDTRSFMLGPGEDVLFKNNISQNAFFSSQVGNYHLEHYFGTSSSPRLDYNAFYVPGLFFQYKGSAYTTFSAYQGASGQDQNSITLDPLFTNAAAGDFTLQSTSPCIDRGDFLTRTSAAGSGATVPVLDARYFSDGYGLREGDLVQIGNSRTRVIGVDYNAKTLTVQPPVSWASGDGVSYPYSRSAPDMGALEYQSVVAPPAPPRSLRFLAP